jgi:small nuclear ribonucleoprotein (snRNP)-like protein
MDAAKGFIKMSELLHSLLNEIIRVTITDGRIFLGSFVGTDRELNIILLNADEFRIEGPDENLDGRCVGQIMIPWKLIARVEVKFSQQNSIYS